MIIEGLVTTRCVDGRINVAPMGPIVEDDFATLRFRPFPGSATYENLERTRCGVFHVVDDVLLLVQTALNLPHPEPAVHPAEQINGVVLEDCCRWYEFRIESVDLGGDRPQMLGRTIHHGRRRDGVGFNRARHAVIEATITATRLHLLPRAEVEAELERCQVRVAKTGDAREHVAFQLVRDYVAGQSFRDEGCTQSR
jgi:hypothetical protein